MILFFFFSLLRYVVTVHSSVYWIHLCILLCIHTIYSLQWAHNTRNSCGGRNILQLCKWFVYDKIVELRLYNIISREDINKPFSFLAILGTICFNHGTCIPIIVHWMQLSTCICLVDRYARRYVLLLIQRILQISLQNR